MEEKRPAGERTAPKTGLFKLLAVVSLLPFALLMLFGRLRPAPPAWFETFDSPGTIALLIPLSFLGAYTCRRSGFLNLNAAYGIIASMQVLLISWMLFNNLIAVIATLILIAPVAYLLVTAHKPDFLKKEADKDRHNPEISDITVLSFIMGKGREKK